MLKVIPFVYDDFDDLKANTFIVIDSSSRCIVVDPSDVKDSIIKYIQKNNLTVAGIFLTHGHIDHVRGVDKLAEYTKAPVYISFFDEPILRDPVLNFSSSLGADVVISTKANTFSDGDKFNLLEEELQVIHTPYHTIGSSCFYFKESNILFSGDSLFNHGIGRYDLPNSNRKSIYTSLAKLAKLPDETKVYPGHGPFTDIRSERSGNPFIK